MKIGVLGVGRIGVMHARNLLDDPRVDEVVLLGRDQGRLTAGAEEVRSGLRAQPAATSVTVRRSDTPVETAADLDGLLIATSTATHPAFVLEAAARSLPVLVEKPLAKSSEALARLSDKLDAFVSPVMVAFQRRYDPAHRELRRRVLSGEAGMVRVVRATGHDGPPLSLDYIPQSGGMWLDMLVHDFDAVPWVVGQRVVEVYATGSVMDEPTYSQYGDTDTCAAVLTFDSGAVGVVTGTRRTGSGHDIRLEVVGTAATFSTGIEPRMPVASTEPGVPAPEGPRYEESLDRFDVAFRSEAAHFLGVLDGTAENETPPRAGMQAVKIAEAAAQSRREHRPVEVTP